MVARLRLVVFPFLRGAVTTACRSTRTSSWPSPAGSVLLTGVRPVERARRPVGSRPAGMRRPQVEPRVLLVDDPPRPADGHRRGIQLQSHFLVDPLQTVLHRLVGVPGPNRI